MDGCVILFGLVIWFFAVIGLMSGGKQMLRWIGQFLDRNPQRLPSSKGDWRASPTSHTHAQRRPEPATPHGNSIFEDPA